VQGSLTFKFDKKSLIHSVSYLNFWGLGALFGAAKVPRQGSSKLVTSWLSRRHESR